MIIDPVDSYRAIDESGVLYKKIWIAVPALDPEHPTQAEVNCGVPIYVRDGYTSLGIEGDDS